MKPQNQTKDLTEYWDETARGLANALAHLNETWYSSDVSTAIAYANERQRLERKYIQPVKFGAYATLFLFVNFRVTGSKRFQQWRQQIVQQWKNRNPPHTTLPPNQPTPKQYGPGYLESKREREVQQALQSMKIVTDALVSLSVGTSGALFLMHQHFDSMRADFEEAPLVAGKSVIAQHLCPPLVQLGMPYYNHKSATTTNNRPETAAIPPTQSTATNSSTQNAMTFSKFIANCQRRTQVEDQLRQTRGSNETHIFVPYPGIHNRKRRPSS